MTAQGDWGGIFDIRAISTEEMLDISMTLGDYSAGISFDPWVFPVEMLDEATLEDFEVKAVKKRATGSDLLNDDPLLPELGTEIVRSLVKALRAAQVWGQARGEKINRLGKQLRLGFVTLLDSLLSRPFGEFPNPWNPIVTRLRAVDWYLAVLFRLLRGWRAAGQNAALWRKRYPRDVEAIENAKRNVLRVRRLVAGEPQRMVFLPWESGFSATQEKAFGSPRLTDNWLQGSALIERQRSIRHAAETVAYLVFDQVLVAGMTFKFCEECDGVLESGEKFCCPQCGSRKINRDLYDDDAPRLNLRRVETAIKAITDWKVIEGKRASNSCRKFVEERLRKEIFKGKPLIEPSTRHSRVVGSWITAAKTPVNSDERQKLIDRCTEPGKLSSHTLMVKEKVNALLELICEVKFL